MKKVLKLFSKLRNDIFELAPTRYEEVPESEDLSKSFLDKVFDIDIFFSRKPGMRRSIQLIMSDGQNSDYVKLSCLTALASLCDTMIANKELNVNEEDIVKFMAGWLDMHNIKISDIKENS